MGREESNSSTDGSQEESSSKGFSIQQLILQSTLLMGNHYICGKEEYEQGEIEVGAMPGEMNEFLSKKLSQRDEKADATNVEFLECLPETSDEILQALIREKPFQRQLQQQSNMLIFRLNPFQIYFGLFDQALKPQGWGRMYWSDGTLGVGEHRLGKPVGEHYLFLPDGSFYKGFVDETYAIVKGEYNSKDFKYKGDFKDYQMHGKGVEHHKDYDFQGQYSCGKRLRGTLRWKDKNFMNVYRGNFNEYGQFEGEGQLETRQGFYKGNFRQGVKQGQGTFEYTNGLTYHGGYHQGQHWGMGRIINSNRSVCYEGSFENGLPHGWGKSWDQEGNFWQGEFRYGVGASFYDRLQALSE